MKSLHRHYKRIVRLQTYAMHSISCTVSIDTFDFPQAKMTLNDLEWMYKSAATESDVHLLAAAASLKATDLGVVSVSGIKVSFYSFSFQS